MSDGKISELTEELRQFQEEKEKIRQVVGQIGGARSRKRETVITGVFIVLLVLLFAVDIFRHLFGIPVPFPTLFSLELGILLVSIKIIWMIHKQTRVEHFQFWILNFLEFRIDQMSKRLTSIDHLLRDMQNGESSDSE